MAHYPHLNKNDQFSCEHSTSSEPSTFAGICILSGTEFGTFTVVFFKVSFNGLAWSLTASGSGPINADPNLRAVVSVSSCVSSRLLIHCRTFFFREWTHTVYISLLPLANEWLANYIGPESRSCMRDLSAFAHITLFFTFFCPAASYNLGCL
jgi:hypothetical protein